MNFYKLYPGDYARDTGHLSHAEHGAYFLMLNAYYGSGKPLPSEPERLYRLLHATTETEQASVDYVLSQFWRRTPEGWVNGRAEVELAKAEAAAEVSRANGRKRKPGGIPAGIPSSIPDGIQPDTRYQIPENQNQSEKECVSAPARVAKALPSDHPDSAFLNMAPFEAVYPKRSGSQRRMDAAAEATARMKEGYAWEDMIAGAERYRAYCEAAGIIGTQYVMEAMTFLGMNLEFLNPWDPPAKPLTARQRRDRASNDAVRRRLIKTAEETGYGTDTADDIRGNHHVGDAVRQRLANG